MIRSCKAFALWICLCLGAGALRAEPTSATKTLELVSAVGRLSTVLANHAELNHYKRAALFSISADVIRVINDASVLINGKGTVDGYAWMSLDAINFFTNVWNATEQAVAEDPSLIDHAAKPESVEPIVPVIPEAPVVEEVKQPEITIRSVEFLPVPQKPAPQPAPEPTGKKKKKNKKKNQPQPVQPVVQEPLKVIIDIAQHAPAPVVIPEPVRIPEPIIEEPIQAPVQMIDDADALAWEYIAPTIEAVAAIAVALENDDTQEAKYRRLLFQRVGLYTRILSEYFGRNKGSAKAKVFMAIGVGCLLKLMNDFASEVKKTYPPRKTPHGQVGVHEKRNLGI